MSENEEETILYIEFNGMLHEDILRDPNLTFKFIGQDTDNPILQIGDEIYEGEYEDTYGTNVIFEEDKNPPQTQADEVFGKNIPKRVQYVCKTNKLLKMNRVFLTEKNSTPTATLPNEPVTSFSKTYDEALSKLSECYVGVIKPDNEQPENTK